MAPPNYRFSSSDGIGVAGIVLTLVLLALDKTGKLKGALLIWLIVFAGLMTLGVAMGNSWVLDAPTKWKLWRGIFMFCIVALFYSGLCLWVTEEPKTTTHEGSRTGNDSVAPTPTPTPTLTPTNDQPTPSGHTFVIQSTTPKYPAVDFTLEPEKTKPEEFLSRPPSLILIIKNRGAAPIAEVKLRATQYQFDYNAIIPATVTKLPGDKIQINPGKYELAFNKRRPPSTGVEETIARRVKGSGGEKRTDLSKMQSFRFVKPPNPGEPGGAGGPPLGGPAGESDELRFYALRFTFLDQGTNRRFAYYKVISCKQPYLLPFDNPAIGITVDPEGRQAYFLAPIDMMLADQKEIYKLQPEQEYIPAQAGMSIQ